jgi:hypothetical protein
VLLRADEPEVKAALVPAESKRENGESAALYRMEQKSAAAAAGDVAVVGQIAGGGAGSAAGSGSALRPRTAGAAPGSPATAESKASLDGPLILKLELTPMSRIRTSTLHVKQNGKCADCKAVRALLNVPRSAVVAMNEWFTPPFAQELDMGLFGVVRYCHYTGRLFCKSCHAEQLRPIPGRVLAFADCTGYAVCNAAAKFLDTLHGTPCIQVRVLCVVVLFLSLSWCSPSVQVSEVAPHLFKLNERMRLVQAIRKQVRVNHNKRIRVAH